jgi:hypothetical protein
MQLEQANTMTLQELFDYAIEKLVEQGKPAMSGTGSCYYGIEQTSITGGTITLHCGIGYLLDESDQELMGQSFPIKKLIEEYPNKIPDRLKANVLAATRFQELHDEEYTEVRQEALIALHTLYHIDVTTNPAYAAWVQLGK